MQLSEAKQALRDVSAAKRRAVEDLQRAKIRVQILDRDQGEAIKKTKVAFVAHSKAQLETLLREKRHEIRMTKVAFVASSKVRLGALIRECSSADSFDFDSDSDM
jgi:maltodextrin utilization protein YvdJ